MARNSKNRYRRRRAAFRGRFRHPPWPHRCGRSRQPALRSSAAAQVAVRGMEHTGERWPRGRCLHFHSTNAPWVRGGPWAWPRSPEACVRGAVSTLCGAMLFEHQELMAVKVSALHNLRHLIEGVVTGRRPGRMEARNSASAPCSMAPRRALGHGGTMCTQPIAGSSTRARRRHFLQSNSL